MTPKNNLFAICLFLIISTLVNCGTSLSPIPLVTPDPNSGSPDIGVTPTYYPHTLDWKNPANHGKSYRDTIKNGQDPQKSLCLICHKFRKDSPECSSCHILYPHENNWADATQHGAYVTTNGTNACATQCHGTDLKNGLSGISCKSCHHPQDWANPENHGLFVLQNEKESCRRCHGEDLKGGIIGVTCYNSNCHTTYPHPDQWETGENHGLFAFSQGKVECQKCHGDNLKGGISKISCSSSTCHMAYPHTPEWNKGENHGLYALQNTKDECKKCHGEDLKGGISDITCFNSSCHVSYPHSTEWNKPENHGFFVLQNEKESCRKCHGEDLKGGISNISCYNSSCHTAYPHAAQWAEGANHGLFAISKGKEDCKKCHGEDLQGGISNISCSQASCHTSYPHDDNWATVTGHGDFVLQNNKEECKKCHGDDLKGGDTNISCYKCHQDYPHIEGWKDKHGTHLTGLPGDIFSNIDQSCQTSECHGVQGVARGVPDCSSSNCHPSFPGRHRDNEVWKAEGAEGHRQHALIEGTSECALCHNKNSTWSCYSCHEKYPHTDNWIAANNHGAEVLNRNVYVKTPHDSFNEAAFDTKCKNCHGPTESSFDNQYPSLIEGFTENGVKRCYNSGCHPNYPHLHYADYQPILHELGLDILIDQDWPDGHRNFIYYNTGYAGLTLANSSCVTPECIDRVTNILQSTPDQKGCYGAGGGACHNNNRHHDGWHALNSFCETACHIEPY